eukprot:TRINITY_DN1879_c0_g1_i1.p1 TRINITY_DN1879_c0_g1~~TRINITY_DN1879_c0_g1_i1.p1  ORF type:complete len:266 (-),score=55.32 TRINITY_DN1879_c0_g1_i1:549-1346(-)
MAGANVEELRRLLSEARQPWVQHFLNRHLDEALMDLRCQENPQTAIQEVSEDVAELKTLLPQAKAVEPLLRAELSRAEERLEKLMKVVQEQESEAKALENRRGNCSFVEIKKYAWDQTDAFVKVYVSIDGLEKENQLEYTIHSNRVDLRCYDARGHHYSLVLGPLCEPIDKAQSSVLVKPGRFVLKLKKAVGGVEWASLDNLAKLQKLRHEQLVHSGASTAELLANMYAQADDETRQSLAHAAHEGRLKREEQNLKMLSQMGVAP